MNYGVSYYHFMLEKEIRVFFEQGTSLVEATDICEALRNSTIFIKIALIEKNLEGVTRIIHQYN